MRVFYLITSLFIVTISAKVCGQINDSTSNFKFYPLESVSIKENFDDSIIFQGESQRATLLLFDKESRHCFLTVKLTEYKSGRKIIENIIFFKNAVSGNSSLHSLNDSSMLFALYRKHITDTQYIWGFRTPSAFKTQTIQLHNKDDSYMKVAIPQNFLNNKIAIGKPFPLLVITLPDATGNFPFLRAENKNRYPVEEWSKEFKLKHTFVVEILIEKREDKKISTTEL